MVGYMNKKKIRPNPKAYADRAALMIRNKMKNQIAMMMKKPPDYYNLRKNAFV